jgi:hypothetical protein
MLPLAGRMVHVRCSYFQVPTKIWVREFIASSITTITAIFSSFYRQKTPWLAFVTAEIYIEYADSNCVASFSSSHRGRYRHSLGGHQMCCGKRDADEIDVCCGCWRRRWRHQSNDTVVGWNSERSSCQTRRQVSVRRNSSGSPVSARIRSCGLYRSRRYGSYVRICNGDLSLLNHSPVNQAIDWQQHCETRMSSEFQCGAILTKIVSPKWSIINIVLLAVSKRVI